MNKHFKSALIHAAAEEIIKMNMGVSYEDLNDLLEIEDVQNELDVTEDFDEKVNILVDIYIQDQEEEDDDEAIEEEEEGQSLEEIIDNLHVGVNIIPGVGMAVAKDEKDLQEMKDYLKGWIQVGNLLGDLLSKL